MFLVDRPDGKKVRGRQALNAVMPYMMPGRNQSAVYYEKDIDLENALRHVRAKNLSAGEDASEGGSEDRYSLFGLVLAAAVRTIALKPQLNRFIHGHALYQRDRIVISFIVKQKLTEEAPEGSAKIFFEPGDDLEIVSRKVNEAIAYVRLMGEGGEGERIAKTAHAIPGAKALIIGAYRLLDRLNLAPWALIKTDPLYATAYFANLGSLGLDTPYHHLYEWGNASLFMVMGKLQQADGRQGRFGPGHHFVNFKVTLDERIADGLYFARSASIFSRLIARPELLEADLEEARIQIMGEAENKEGRN
ncbi:MAG: hypothetical protein NT061_01405 [Spirochaetes bacterium]|nr:hypothetical protein [Spirochaetota bacterium]